MTAASSSEKKTILSKDTAISFGVVIAMISVAVWTTSSHQVIRSEIENLNKQDTAIMQKLNALDEKLTSHIAKGIDGLPHPDGTTYTINAMKKEFQEKIDQLRKEVIDKSNDRWKRVDDFLFMKDFATINNLKLPPHETVTDKAIKGN